MPDAVNAAIASGGKSYCSSVDFKFMNFFFLKFSCSNTNEKGCQFDHIIITINIIESSRIPAAGYLKKSAAEILFGVLIVDAHRHAYYNHNEL